MLLDELPEKEYCLEEVSYVSLPMSNVYGLIDLSALSQNQQQYLVITLKGSLHLIGFDQENSSFGELWVSDIPTLCLSKDLTGQTPNSTTLEVTTSTMFMEDLEKAYVAIGIVQTDSRSNATSGYVWISPLTAPVSVTSLSAGFRSGQLFPLDAALPVFLSCLRSKTSLRRKEPLFLISTDTGQLLCYRKLVSSRGSDSTISAKFGQIFVGELFPEFASTHRLAGSLTALDSLHSSGSRITVAGFHTGCVYSWAVDTGPGGSVRNSDQHKFDTPISSIHLMSVKGCDRIQMLLATALDGFWLFDNLEEGQLKPLCQIPGTHRSEVLTSSAVFDPKVWDNSGGDGSESVSSASIARSQSSGAEELVPVQQVQPPPSDSLAPTNTTSSQDSVDGSSQSVFALDDGQDATPQTMSLDLVLDPSESDLAPPFSPREFANISFRVLLGYFDRQLMVYAWSWSKSRFTRITELELSASIYGITCCANEDEYLVRTANGLHYLKRTSN